MILSANAKFPGLTDVQRVSGAMSPGRERAKRSHLPAVSWRWQKLQLAATLWQLRIASLQRTLMQQLVSTCGKSGRR